MKLSSLLLSLCIAPAGLLAAGAGKPVDVSKLPLPVPRPVDFVKEVYPIFKESCIISD